MFDLLASGSLILIQLFILVRIIGEVVDFSNRTIYKDFPKTFVTMKKQLEARFSIEDLKTNRIIGEKSKDEYSIYTIIMADKWLSIIWYLSSFIAGLSIILIFFTAIIWVLNSNAANETNVLLIRLAWLFVLLMDASLVFFRGISRVGNILNDFNEKYAETQVFNIVLGNYLSKKE